MGKYSGSGLGSGGGGGGEGLGKYVGVVGGGGEVCRGLGRKYVGMYVGDICG